jgi:RNA polymerase sigma factor (sigma-70 family)
MLASSDPAPPEGVLEMPALPEAGERALVQAILRRDRNATAEFVSLHADRIYSYVRGRFMPRAAAVDDVVQEVFLAPWQRLGDYRHEAPLDHWLLGIARHKVEDFYRLKLRDAAELSDDEAPPPSATIEPDWDDQLDQRDRQARAPRDRVAAGNLRAGPAMTLLGETKHAGNCRPYGQNGKGDRAAPRPRAGALQKEVER